MSKQTLKLVATFCVLLFVVSVTGCKDEKKSTDRTPTVPKVTVSVELKKDATANRTMQEFLVSPEILNGISSDYFEVLGFASQDELLKDLKGWLSVNQIEGDETVFRLEVNGPTVPLGAAVLRAWIDEIKKSIARGTSIEVMNRLIGKSEAKGVELNRALRKDFSQLVRVTAEEPDVLVNSQLGAELPQVWDGLNKLVEDSHNEKRFDAVKGLQAIRKFEQARVGGILLQGSLSTLRSELDSCVLSWEAMHQALDRKTNLDRIQEMQDGLQDKIDALGADAPEVVATQRRIKALTEMAEIQGVGQQFINPAQNDSAYSEVAKFFEAETKKIGTQFSSKSIEDGQNKLRELTSNSGKLGLARAELEEIRQASKFESPYDYRFEVLGKIRRCATNQSDFDAYEKLRGQHEFLPEIKFVIRNQSVQE